MSCGIICAEFFQKIFNGYRDFCSLKPANIGVPIAIR